MMPELTKPFQLVPDRKLTKVELVAAIRQAVIAEHDATAQYALQAEATDDPLVKKVLLSIADEERVHIGELTHLLEYLTENEDELLQKGRDEADGEARGVISEREEE
jgi:rubrerythrin